MDLWKTLLVVLRRWYIVVPIAALSLAAALTMSGRVQPEYSADAAVLLTTAPEELPEGEAEEGTTNPYVGSLPVTAAAMQFSLSDADTVRQLGAEGLSTRITVAAQPRSPIMTVNAVGDSPEQAVETMRRLTELLVERLDALQEEAGVSEERRIVVDIVSQSEIAAVDDGGSRRVLLLVGALGVALSFVVAFAVDGLVLSRRRARGAETAGEPGEAEAIVEEPGEVEAVADEAAPTSGTTEPEADGDTRGGGDDEGDAAGEDRAEVERVTVSSPGQ